MKIEDKINIGNEVSKTLIELGKLNVVSEDYTRIFDIQVKILDILNKDKPEPSKNKVMINVGVPQSDIDSLNEVIQKLEKIKVLKEECFGKSECVPCELIENTVTSYQDKTDELIATIYETAKLAQGSEFSSQGRSLAAISHLIDHFRMETKD